MRTAIQVSCYGTGSLREKIVSDERLKTYGLKVSQQMTPGRNPGWAKLHSLGREIPGAINLEWDGSTRTLTARVITRGGTGPDEIVGRFVAYLMGRHRRRVRSILVLPG